MKLISIYHNGIEIDYILESLALKTDQSIFPDSLKFTASEYPFLIIENEKTETAFGKNNVILHTPQYFTIEVRTFNTITQGELQILECQKEYRKANVRFASKLYNAGSSKIREMGTSISVINEFPPRPFTEKYDGIPPNPIAYANYVKTTEEGSFPTQLWKAPFISFPTQFGEPKEGDTWYNYVGGYNAVLEGQYVLNTYNETAEGTVVDSRNVPTWCVYLLTPLILKCARLGLSFPQELLTDKFACSLAFLTKENNLTEVINTQEKENLYLGAVSWTYLDGYPGWTPWQKRIQFDKQIPGKYSFKYKFKATDDTLSIEIGNRNWGKSVEYRDFRGEESYFEGEFNFEIKPEDANYPVAIYFRSRNRHDILEPDIEYMYVETLLHQSGFMFHPTIEIGRYLPDWTFSEYLNQLRILFNIQFVESNNGTKLEAIYLDELLSEVDYVDLGSLHIDGYPKHEVIQLKYKFDNDIDPAHIYSEFGGSLEITDEKVKVFESKFKQTKTPLTKEEESKSGIGLVLINGTSDDLTNSIENTTITTASIFERYYKKTATKYLQSNRLNVELNVTQLVLHEIETKKRVLINKLPYYVESLSKESSISSLITIKLDLMPI
ncbi:hypothetical protein [Myroides odoratus]|uniref:hypothetical protein n=1 Tax=Myroides odoratus TaxID=256 RepID=UPI003341F35E